MVGLSPAGLLGAVIGTAIAALVYGRVVAWVERALRARDRSESGMEEHALLLRVVLATDIIVFAGIGYWLGAMIGG